MPVVDDGGGLAAHGSANRAHKKLLRLGHSRAWRDVDHGLNVPSKCTYHLNVPTIEDSQCEHFVLPAFFHTLSRFSPVRRKRENLEKISLNTIA